MARRAVGAQLIHHCRSQVQAAGFNVRGASAIRDRGALLEGIAVRESRNYKGRFQVSLDVAIFDPFLAKPAHVVCLRGYVAQSKASHRQVWWGSDEAEQAALSLLAYGIPWLEERGEISRLIELFERGIAAGRSLQDMDTTGEANEIANSIIRNMVPGAVPAFPFVYHHWLSLLYHHSGPDGAAQSYVHSRKYLERVGRSELELERARRQFAAMGWPVPCP
jgi:hypothetical protein